MVNRANKNKLASCPLARHQKVLIHEEHKCIIDVECNADPLPEWSVQWIQHHACTFWCVPRHNIRCSRSWKRQDMLQTSLVSAQLPSETHGAAERRCPPSADAGEGLERSEIGTQRVRPGKSCISELETNSRWKMKIWTVTMIRYSNFTYWGKLEPHYSSHACILCAAT